MGAKAIGRSGPEGPRPQEREPNPSVSAINKNPASRDGAADFSFLDGARSGGRTPLGFDPGWERGLGHVNPSVSAKFNSGIQEYELTGIQEYRFFTVRGG